MVWSLCEFGCSFKIRLIDFPFYNFLQKPSRMNAEYQPCGVRSADATTRITVIYLLCQIFEHFERTLSVRVMHARLGWQSYVFVVRLIYGVVTDTIVPVFST